MRNLTRLKAVLFLAASICFSTAYAQFEDGTDLTDRIINNSFESTEYTDLGPYPGDPDKGYAAGTGKRQQPEGWIYESIMTGSNDSYSIKAGTTDRRSADGVQHFNSWGERYVYSNLYQPLEDLPAGAYRLTACMRVTSSSNPHYLTDQHIYGMNSDGLIFNSPHLSLAGLGTADENWETLEVLIIMKNPGTLTIGATSNGDAQPTSPKGWFQCDYFRLTYLGSEEEYGVEYYNALNNEALEKLQSYNRTDYLSSGPYKTLTDAMDLYWDNYESTDLTVLENLLTSLNEALTEVEENAAVVLELQDLLHEIYSDYEPNKWNGYDEMYAVAVKAYNYYDNPNGTNDNGELLTTEDTRAMVKELEAAIRDYRFKEPASIDLPADFTWALLSPQFTKKGGNPAVSADASFEGWAYDNDPATGSQYRLNHVNGKNCWNSYKDDVIRMNVFQDLEGMPAGYYTFSCYQTNNGAMLTDQHAYMTTVSGTSDSPYATYSHALDPDPDKGDFTANSKWEGPLETGLLFVGADGKIRVGFASTGTGSGSSGWFCITDCELKYYGMTDDAYEEAMNKVIQDAEALKDSDMLTTNSTKLDQAIATAKAVDTSDTQAAEKGLTDLNSAISETKEAIQTLATFKAGSYGTALDMANNDDMVYPDEISNLMNVVIEDQDKVLKADTTTLLALPSLTAIVDQYLSYVDAYMEVEEFIFDQDQYNEIKLLLAMALEEQTEKVTVSISNIRSAKVTFTNLISFAGIYNIGVDCSYNEEFDPNMAAEISILCKEQLEIVSEDHSKAPEAELILTEAIGKIRFAGLGIEAGEDTEVTELVIVNPGVEAASSSLIPNGWTAEKIDGSNYLGRGQHWSGDADNNRYLDSWNATPGKLRYTAQQTLKGIPNGTYKLVAAVRADGDGAHLFAKVPTGFELVEIFNDGSTAGNIWASADVDSDEYKVNGEKGYGWNWMEITGINVYTNSMTIGCSNDPAFTGSDIAWTGTWFSADDFKLYYTSDEFYVGIEDVEMEADSQLFVYSENGYITVVGAEEYSIFTLNGTQIPANAKLEQGIYIVKAANKVAKVAVK